jgi:hypothetical protein
MLSEDIWLQLQEVGELSQTGEFRNIDKRKKNVNTELLIENGGGGYENVHLHWRGLRKFFHRFLGGYGNMYLKFHLSSTPLVITL